MSRLVLITGGNRGLGLETAHQMKSLGYRVLLTSRDPAKGKAAARGLGVDFHPLDVASPDSIAVLAAYIENKIGRLDALVNNAAVLPNEDLSLLETPAETLRLTLETNSLAPLWLARAFLPLMIAQNYGRIVNVSSGMGQIHELDDYASSYRLSKLLLNGITRILADTVTGKKCADQRRLPWLGAHGYGWAERHTFAGTGCAGHRLGGHPARWRSAWRFLPGWQTGGMVKSYRQESK